jgi:hypothetical protein
MAETCIYRPKNKNVSNAYIALSSQVDDELDIVAIWYFMLSGSYKPHLKIGDIC